MIDFLKKNLIRAINKILLIPLKIREKILLKDKDFIIITNNCWGYTIYNTLNRPYNTPLIALYLPPESYINFLKNFPACLHDRLTFIESDKSYPVAFLGDDKITIHFQHYESKAEAEEKWYRRTERLLEALDNNAELFVKLCDLYGCTKHHLDQFHSLPFKNKISITIEEYDHENNLYVPYLKDNKHNSIVNGLQLFRNRYRYFDFAKWILTGSIVKYSGLLQKERKK